MSIPSFGSGAQLIGTSPLVEAMQRRGLDVSPLQMQSVGSAGYNPFIAPGAPPSGNMMGGMPSQGGSAPPMPTPVPTPMPPQGMPPQNVPQPGLPQGSMEANVIIQALSTRLKNISDMEKKQFEAANPSPVTPPPQQNGGNSMV